MSVKIELETVQNQCSFVPLAVIGYCLTTSKFLQPVWDELTLGMKTIRHSPTEKLQDVIVAIMAGCQTLAAVNTVLRPERPLAFAWQRPQFAEQSSLSRVLDAMSAIQVAQLRQGSIALLRQHSQLRHHSWSQAVVIDVDPTSLMASRQAEGSYKGWVSTKRNQFCRHVLRFTLAGYHENLLSLTYPGNRHGFEYFKEALDQLFQLWPELANHPSQVIIRSDAELGTDQNLSYLLWLHCQLLMKGYSGTRTKSWVAHLPSDAWLSHPDMPKRWVASSPVSLRLGRRMDSYLLRWLDRNNQFAHATLHTTLPYPPFDLWQLYDGRALTEIEIRADKSGLKLHLRRKHSLAAQEGWVHLTDIAHNIVAWLETWMLAGTAFAKFGPKRIVNELLTIPGQVVIEGGRLTKVTLWQSHPYASEMRLCLENLLKTFDLL